MIVVDASVWVSISVPVDKFHVQSVAWLRSVRATMDDLAAPNIVLAEVAGAVARRTESADLGLRGADAIYVATAVHLRCPLVTWDAEMIRKTSGVIEAWQPTI